MAEIHPAYQQPAEKSKWERAPGAKLPDRDGDSRLFSQGDVVTQPYGQWNHYFDPELRIDGNRWVRANLADGRVWLALNTQ